MFDEFCAIQCHRVFEDIIFNALYDHHDDYEGFDETQYSLSLNSPTYFFPLGNALVL